MILLVAKIAACAVLAICGILLLMFLHTEFGAVTIGILLVVAGTWGAAYLIGTKTTALASDVDNEAKALNAVQKECSDKTTYSCKERLRLAKDRLDSAVARYERSVSGKN